MPSRRCFVPSWRHDCLRLLQVAEHRDDPDPRPPDRVQDGTFAGEDDHVRLRTAAAGASTRVSRILQQLDLDGKALRLAQPTLVRRYVGELAGRRLITLLDAPADASDAGMEKLAWIDVERD